MAATAHLPLAAPDTEKFTVVPGRKPTSNIDRGSISPSPRSGG
jgi:hypothetical protein